MIRRKDEKGRVLKEGESKRSDGRYQFRYVAENGKRHTIYAKNLQDLRKKEKDVLKKVEEGIKTTEDKVTLNDIYELYINNKAELKPSTRANYKYLYNKYVKNSIGYKKINTFKYSDINIFYRKLLKEGFKIHSLESVHSVLHPVFTLAVRDGYIRNNPTDGIIAELKKSMRWVAPKRHSLTIDEQKKIMNFVKNSDIFNRWLNLLTVLLGTGMRISELCGLRWKDCDFEENLISINHNLIYKLQENGKTEFHITTPKTNAGTRIIPMLDVVKDALLNEYEKQKIEGFNKTIIDGFSGFIFKTRDGNVTTQHNVTRAIKRIVLQYNKEEMLNAEIESRPPVFIREFTAHSLRHTFCTRFCENESNVKVIQEIMGHSDISTTMNVYAEATLDTKKFVFEKLNKSINLF